MWELPLIRVRYTPPSSSGGGGLGTGSRELAAAPSSAQIEVWPGFAEPLPLFDDSLHQRAVAAGLGAGHGSLGRGRHGGTLRLRSLGTAGAVYGPIYQAHGFFAVSLASAVTVAVAAVIALRRSLNARAQ